MCVLVNGAVERKSGIYSIIARIVKIAWSVGGVDQFRSALASAISSRASLARIKNGECTRRRDIEWWP